MLLVFRKISGLIISALFFVAFLVVFRVLENVIRKMLFFDLFCEIRTYSLPFSYF